MRRTRAYRRHQRARIKARHLHDYYTLMSTATDFTPPKDIATRHPLDCGRRCMLCHMDKLMGLPTLAELRQQDRERDDWDLPKVCD